MPNSVFRKFEHHVTIFEGDNDHSTHNLPIVALSMLIPVSPSQLSDLTHTLKSTEFTVNSKAMGISRC